ncbi:MAG TPA: hypothetical protein VFW94_10760, partial [Candidatus Acidoferrales bacterium]|nr:hypothetical protein [Candidatus Acidoferrales bacterium]
MTKNIAGHKSRVAFRLSFLTAICILLLPTGAPERSGAAAANSGARPKYGTPKVASSAQSASRNRSQSLQNNSLIREALSHAVQIGPRASVTGGDTSYSTVAGLLRKQSTVARSLLLPAMQSNQGQTGANGATLLNGGTKVTLTPQPYPPKSSVPLLGTSRTTSASGAQTGSLSSNRTATQVSPSNETTRTRPDGGGRTEVPSIGRETAPMQTQMCRAGIGAVDGAANSVWFSPVAGQDGQFVVQGCGFGNTVGEVYLSGVQYAKDRLTSQAGISSQFDSGTFPDRVYFRVPPNGWTDRQIVAQIDANASGLYDTNNVELVVKAANGTTYQAIGMNFLAARADQVVQRIVTTQYPTGPDSCYGLTLSECLVPGVNLAIVNSAVGPLNPEVESPTKYWLTAGRTVAVVRGVIYLESTDRYSVIFPSGTDTYQFHLAPGFQLDPQNGVQLTHASMDASLCQSIGGVYSKSGDWAINYTSTSSFQVSWQEEACSPRPGLTTMSTDQVHGFAGQSIYELL